MTDEQVEPTKESLDALIEATFPEIGALNPTRYWALPDRLRRREGAYALRDAILSSQPERVECDEENHRYFREDNGYKFCPDCGQLLEGDTGA